jgi:hypothetical protein
MEVHAHTHTQRKKWTHYLWEFIMLFLAVSLGFYAENLREGFLHKNEVRTHMQSLLSDLQADISLYDSVIDRNGYSSQMADSVVELLHNSKPDVASIYFAARSVTANLGYYYSNSKSFEQMKASGLLRYIKPKKLLDSIGNYYISFQWLSNQTDLMRLKLDEVHKGNTVLFDSYTFNEMMKVNLANFNGRRLIINRPVGNPVLLSQNFKDINMVSLNYHYYSSTTKFYNRTAVIQRQRALRLIELIKGTYGFE